LFKKFLPFSFQAMAKAIQAPGEILEAQGVGVEYIR
jgi:hypothetical protein